MKRSTKAVLAALLVSFSAGALISCSNDKKPQQQDPQTQEQGGTQDQGGNQEQGGQQQEQGYVEKDVNVTKTLKLINLVIGEDGKPVMGQFGPETEKLDYDVTLKTTVADHKFTLNLVCKSDATRKFNFKGNYTFANGVGYKFVMDGSKTEVHTVYNRDTKEHSFVFNAPLQRYGKDTVKLEIKDEAFTISDEKLFLSNVVFGGGYFNKDGIVIETPGKKEKGVGFGLWLNADGSFTFDNNHIKQLRQYGTYTFDKATKTVTLNYKDADGTAKTVTSTFENGVMKLAFEFNYKNAEEVVIKLPVNMEFNTNYYGGHGLSGISYPMGSEFKVTLTLNNDGTAFIDGTPTDPTKGALAGMNLFTNFDTKGTWTFDEATKQYTVKYKVMVMGPNGQPVMGPQGPQMKEVAFTTTYDETTKLYTIKDFVLGAAKLNLTGKDFGKDFQAK